MAMSCQRATVAGQPTNNRVEGMLFLVPSDELQAVTDRDKVAPAPCPFISDYWHSPTNSVVETTTIRAADVSVGTEIASIARCSLSADHSSS